MRQSMMDVSDLIGAIYDCAMDPSLWTPTLERIGKALSACNGQVMSRAGEGLSFAATWGTSEEERLLFMEKFEPINPFSTMDWHFDIDVPVTVPDFMPREELQGTLVYRDYLKPRGWEDFVLTIVEKSASRVTTFGFTRHEKDGYFSEEDLALMALIAPHVRRAVSLGGIIANVSARASGLEAILHHLPAPMVLVDQNARIIEANAAAARLFGERTGAASLPARADRKTPLEVRLAAALADPATPQSVPLGEDEGRALIAHVFPFRNAIPTGPLGMQARSHAHHPNLAEQERISNRPREYPSTVAAIFVQEVGTLQPLPGEVLVKLYKLTPAETRLLALLARGLSLDEAVDALGIAVSTARTQLQRVFEKTGTRRQADLVRLVLSAFPAPPG